MFICQLERKKRYAIYKAMKAFLISEGLYTQENITNAMGSRVNDLRGLHETVDRVLDMEG